MHFQIKNTIILGLFTVVIMILSGCSAEYLREGYVPPSARPATTIPEIRHQTVGSKTSTKKTVKPYKPQVTNYSISSSTTTVINQNDVDAINRDINKIDENPKASLEIDPYAAIPETEYLNTTAKNNAPITDTKAIANPAVKSLMMRARADLTVGNTHSAISKLERGLRIESQNPSIWYLLAKAHYAQANHQQAISMAKKSISYLDNNQGGDELVSQNWKLIQKAGEKSDDAIAIKEALDYFKVNP